MNGAAEYRNMAIEERGGRRLEPTILITHIKCAFLLLSSLPTLPELLSFCHSCLLHALCFIRSTRCCITRPYKEKEMSWTRVGGEEPLCSLKLYHCVESRHVVLSCPE